MKKLIRLELQKNNWKPYWITTSITTLVMLGFIYLIALIPYLEPRDDDAVLFGTYNFVIGLSIDVMTGIFTIMSTTMLAKIIVEEYEKKAIVFFSYPIARKKFLTAKIITCLLYTCFLMIISGTIVLSIFIGTEKMFPLCISDVISIQLAIAFAATTTMIHELFHIIYSRNWKNLSRSFHISLKKSVVTVSMTYIWVWSLLARVCAVLAGIILDVILLAVFSISRLLFDNWIVLSAISILWVRVLWQLRFHKNCDGRLFAMLLLDTPLIDDMEEYADNAVYKKTVFIWKILNYVGKIVNLAIVVFWIIPIIVNIFICFFRI